MSHPLRVMHLDSSTGPVVHPGYYVARRLRDDGTPAEVLAGPFTLASYAAAAMKHAGRTR